MCIIAFISKKRYCQSNYSKVLNQAYDDYKEEYDESDQDEERILHWIDIINNFINKETLSFLQKKTQLYTAFCLANYLEQNKFEITDTIQERFTNFVQKYNNFKNSADLEIKKGSFDEKISKYKLAASEGINKIKNRMIRFEILRDILLNDY